MEIYQHVGFVTNKRPVLIGRIWIDLNVGPSYMPHITTWVCLALDIGKYVISRSRTAEIISDCESFA